MNIELLKGLHTIQFERPVKAFKLFLDGDIWVDRNLPDNTTEINIHILFPGDYESNVDFEVIKSVELPQEDNTIKLYERERERERPFIVRYNPSMTNTPARIFTTATPAIIEVGDRYYKYPPAVRMFILLHEYGHLFYKTEHKTDCYALKRYLEMGLPPSMAYWALANVLHKSDASTFRIKKLFNELKTNGYVG